jgi:hypothetical protein
MTYTSTGPVTTPPKITAYGGDLANTVVTAGADASQAGHYSMVNSPKIGGMTVSLVGRNFGYGSGYTPSAALGLTACLTTSWSADTVLRCTSAPGSGAKKAFFVTVGAVVGTTGRWFTFDAPFITVIGPTNGPVASGYTVTMRGHNFGASNASPTARIGNDMCGSSIWISTTSVYCQAGPVRNGPGGTNNDYPWKGKNNHVAVTISAVVGTRSVGLGNGRGVGFTFDAPVPTDLRPANGATSLGSTITLLGMSFGTTDVSSTAALGETACSTASGSPRLRSIAALLRPVTESR